MELQRRAGAAVASGAGRVPVPAVLRPLIGAILAVGVTVAGPQLRDAGGAVALEAGGAAGGLWAERLVGAVQAVPVRVADENLGNALAVMAAELVGGARLGSCADGRDKTVWSLGSPASQCQPIPQMGTLGHGLAGPRLADPERQPGNGQGHPDGRTPQPAPVAPVPQFPHLSTGQAQRRCYLRVCCY